ncbi:NADH-quinone oxidoreductase subunit B family protein [Fervidicoccus fontis]|uniref:NADH-quinone oxidoreductase subunit NuoB n=1 Tax=Fervidicoccus fontis TaxID=683846 RepID=A0A2J6N3K5_9CREN|nr:NADH-quinone oxidoreductase subunit B family protein [Fervidicoccus fontis]PMB75803.1 MAG: NADH:ubiquinone oxidoreductase [Fervidicoccus fontis]PMB76522.1 MAG: NADH:ubiquinone oxidoreductase [Fervidicoccus fontis]HEW63874.1 NADH-quinone oxidoreductase subunit NuoB [Fervidicoccus fontis]
MILEEEGKKLKKRAYDLLSRSVFVLRVDSGSCNGCDISVLASLTPLYDVERFGVKVVYSPRQADVILITGPITRQFYPAMKIIYESTPKPCVVVACGSCASSGGIWYNTYGTLGGADKVVPVDVYIPGCPPRPAAIIQGMLVALDVLEQKIKKLEYSEEKEWKTTESELKFGGLLKSYSVFRSLKLDCRRYLGYKLGNKFLMDYAEIMRNCNSLEELKKKTTGLLSRWNNDSRIKEIIELLNKRVEDYLKG